MLAGGRLAVKARLLVSLFCILSVPTALFGQGVAGAITGLVLDPTQAVVAGANVAVKNVGTGVVIRTQTNNAGAYNVPTLAIGTYEVTVEAQGFKTFIRTNVVVETALTVRVDATLQLGAVGESVTVTSEVPLLQPETSSVGTAVSNTMLVNLPFQMSGARRDPTSFLRLTPGATGGSYGAAIAGGRNMSSEVLVDGVPVAYNGGKNSPDQASPSYDTVAEFRVEAVIPPAEYGRTGGGVVLLATRSGGNEVHGNAFALFRNNVLDARRFNATIPDITRQSEFGGSLGGPVYLPKLYDGRNRTFFFANFTGFRRANVPQGQTATVATNEMRDGNFSAFPNIIFDPLTADASGKRQPFVNNTIPQDRISNIAKQIQSYVPGPNAAGFAANFLGSNPATNDADSFLAKIDHQISDKHKFSGSVRYQNVRRTFSNGPLPRIIDGFVDAPYSRNVVVSDDYIIRPNLVNRLQLGYTRFSDPTVSQPADAGITIPGSFRGGFPAIRFSGQGLNQFAYNDYRTESDDNYNLGDGLTWVKGKHNFKFGVRADQWRFHWVPLGNNWGTYTFNMFTTGQPSVNNTGHAYAAFLLGQPSAANMAMGTPYQNRSFYFGSYAQDDWKVTPRLTVNYGIRWEFQKPWYEVAGRQSQVDLDLPNPGAGGRLGAVAFCSDVTGNRLCRGFQKAHLANFAPRLGLAYQLRPTTIIRAGYGIFYAPLINQHLSTQGFNASISRSSQDGGYTPVFDWEQGWPAGSVVQPPFIDPTVANGGNAVTSFDESSRLARMQQWQLGVQHSFKGTLIETSYVGTVAHGIPNNNLVQIQQLHPQYLALGDLLRRNINDAAVRAAGYGLPYPGFNGTLAQALRPYPQYQGITTYQTPTGNSTYHALLVKAEKRMSNGLQFLVSYAFSKTLSDISFASEPDGAHSAPQDQYNRRAEKSLADADRPNRLVVTYIYELPFGKGRPFMSTGVPALMFGNWSVAGIHSWTSGAPLRITAPNSLPIFNGHLRPNRVPGVDIRIGPSRDDFRALNGMTGEAGDVFLDKAAFSIPEPYTFGNLGYYLPDLRSFGSIGEDISIIKKFRFTESRSMEFRGDFFNAFNRHNLGGPVTDLSNPNFGRITGRGNARVIQLGFRTDF
jgi:hypothetical protein